MTSPTELDQELERIRTRLRRLLGVRTAMGLNEAEEREYAELCHRERMLIHAPTIVEMNGMVIDLDADIEDARQGQNQ